VEVVVPDGVARWDSGSSAQSPLSPLSMPLRPIDSDKNRADRNLVEGEGSTSTSTQTRAAQLSDDEAFARRLAAGSDPESPSQDNADTPTRPQQLRQSLYSDAVSSIIDSPVCSSSSAPLSVDHSSSRQESIPEFSLSRDNSVKSTSSQQSARSDSRPLLSPTSPALLRGSSPVSRSATTDPSSLSAAWPSAALEKRRLSVMSSQSTTPLTDAAPSIHANQFVEQELLLGICENKLSLVMARVLI
jgi:hypothetical protein